MCKVFFSKPFFCDKNFLHNKLSVAIVHKARSANYTHTSEWENWLRESYNRGVLLAWSIRAIKKEVRRRNKKKRIEREKKTSHTLWRVLTSVHVVSYEIVKCLVFFIKCYEVHTVLINQNGFISCGPYETAKKIHPMESLE